MLLNPKPCANLMADAQKAVVSLSMKKVECHRTKIMRRLNLLLTLNLLVKTAGCADSVYNARN